MGSKFYDMNGAELNIGDYCEPTEGRRVKIVDHIYQPEYQEEVLVGQQVEDPDAYSHLTHEDLSTYFRKVMP